ncbi:hypothetical protein [Pontixanthobacter luteolus]|uniref:hypothetical protein n=1 Tax=Pontixanthobacter luteolus TaxID=295089 RepID=UPI0023047B9D|nr:hypothetical protein [Pontixanthobacter luteolus]
MTADQERLAAAAEGLVGVPFQLHGRDILYGVDCVGLVLLALSAVGRKGPSLSGYGLRNADYSFVPDIASSAGLGPAAGVIERGDIVVVRPGPGQRHLLIAAGPLRFIHAHAGLGRVVSAAGPLQWPVINKFRLNERR